jgi:molecular chaperone GrpE
VTEKDSARADQSGEERVVIRDRRKVDRSSGASHPAGDSTEEKAVRKGRHSETREGDSPPPAQQAEESTEAEVRETAEPDTARAEEAEETAGEDRGPLGAELEALRAELDERTRDLQRVSAEYANYRKRVDRDRGLMAEQATGAVLSALLPVLDDLDRAREHGDLVGPFGAVAEQLVGALAKFGLAAFGEKGDPFDPTRHEAVAHQTSSEVTEPTCIDVMRRGYLLGDRLLRPALVAVADPE